MNVRLLRKIAKVIQENPQLYDQDYTDTEVACGTACCIAGWAVRLSLGDDAFEVSENIVDTAKKLLDLTTSQADRLFAEAGRKTSFDEDWPQRFKDDYSAADTEAERAMVGAARIAHFIKTKGAE